VKASDIKLEYQRMAVMRKKKILPKIPMEPRLHIRCTSITYGAQAPSTMREASKTMQKHHIRWTSIKKMFPTTVYGPSHGPMTCH